MKVVGKGNGDDLLSVVPKAPAHLSKEAQAEYKHMGNLLAKAKRLRPYMLGTLEVWADYYAQWQWATSEIAAKNKKENGSGYVQRFKSGATNITTELTLKKEAAQKMFDCAKLFGLDPKSDKDLKSTGDPNQGNLFDAVNKVING